MSTKSNFGLNLIPRFPASTTLTSDPIQTRGPRTRVSYILVRDMGLDAEATVQSANSMLTGMKVDLLEASCNMELGFVDQLRGVQVLDIGC